MGTDPSDVTTRFDHTSVLATIEKRFGIAPLTQRDAAARTLEAALNLTELRADTPLTLPNPVKDSLFTRFVGLFHRAPPAAARGARLSENQKSLLGIALACDLQTSDQSTHTAIRERHAAIRQQKDAAKYVQEIERKIHSRRR